MKTRSTMATVLSAAGVAALVAGGGSAHASTGAPTAPANAAAQSALTGYAVLKAIPAGHGKYAVMVTGRAWLGGWVTPNNLRITLWVDDTFSDDKRYETTATTYGDGSWWVQRILSSGTLDEDWGTDELYATVRVYDPVYGYTTFKSNVLKGNF